MDFKVFPPSCEQLPVQKQVDHAILHLGETEMSQQQAHVISGKNETEMQMHIPQSQQGWALEDSEHDWDKQQASRLPTSPSKAKLQSQLQIHPKAVIALGKNAEFWMVPGTDGSQNPRSISGF